MSNKQRLSTVVYMLFFLFTALIPVNMNSKSQNPYLGPIRKYLCIL